MQAATPQTPFICPIPHKTAMKLEAQAGPELFAIQAYDSTGFVINGKLYPHALLLGSTPAVCPAPCPWPVGQPRQFAEDQAQWLLNWLREEGRTQPEVLLVGTGRQQHFPSIAVRRLFAQQGLSPEWMDTGAACRTYNVLAAEGRQVLVALFLWLDPSPKPVNP